MESLNNLYEQAVERRGTEAADMAAEESVHAFNAAALAGLSDEQCAAEQAAAFAAAID